MKKYKVGDTIYVKGTIARVDDTALPYYVDFGNGIKFWFASYYIIGELPTAKPVKPVLSKEQAEIVEEAHIDEYPAYYISDNTDDEELLMNAYVNGYTVEKEKKYYVKVPHAKTLIYYKVEDVDDLGVAQSDSEGTWVEFTAAEVEHYGLQDCAKMEVTDDEQ